LPSADSILKLLRTVSGLLWLIPCPSPLEVYLKFGPLYPKLIIAHFGTPTNTFKLL
jgi:hypothetical protein